LVGKRLLAIQSKLRLELPQGKGIKSIEKLFYRHRVGEEL